MNHFVAASPLAASNRRKSQKNLWSEVSESISSRSPSQDNPPKESLAFWRQQEFHVMALSEASTAAAIAKYFGTTSQGFHLNSGSLVVTFDVWGRDLKAHWNHRIQETRCIRLHGCQPCLIPQSCGDEACKHVGQTGKIE
jgi:hypothetical protein